MRRRKPSWAEAGPRIDVDGPDLDAALADVQDAGHLSVLGPVRDLVPLGRLTDLRILELRSVRLGDLDALLPLTSLVNLQLRLGSVEHLDRLSALTALQYVELWMVRGLDDVQVLGRLPALESFFLQDQPRVTALPDLSSSHALRSVWLEHMRGIVDLSPLAAAPVLAEVSLVACNHMQPDDFAPLLHCRTLQRVNIGLGSDRKNRAVRDLLGIRGNYGGLTVR
jgi:Leucine-rich repeat (LRR) protein